MDCPKCGYAMSEFDLECPRCKRLQSSPEHPSGWVPPAYQDPAPPAASPQATYAAERPVHSPRPSAAPQVIGAVVVALVLGGAFLAYMSGTEALRKFNAGAREHAAGNLTRAMMLYRESIAADPDYPLPHLNLGLALLGGGLAEGVPESRINQLMASGVFGDTRELERADECFKKAIDAAKKLPSGEVVGLDFEGDELTANDVTARAHLNLAVTALVRTGSAEQAASPGIAYQWAGVCRQHLAAARQHDPDIAGVAALDGLLTSAGY